MEGKGTINLENKDYDVPRGAGVYLGPSETATIKAGRRLLEAVPSRRSANSQVGAIMASKQSRNEIAVADDISAVELRRCACTAFRSNCASPNSAPTISFCRISSKAPAIFRSARKPSPRDSRPPWNPAI